MTLAGRWRLVRLDARLAWLRLRLAWLHVRIWLVCRTIGTTPDEARREARLREIAGRD